MGININTNLSALNTQRSINKLTTTLQSLFTKVSSGKRITSAASDAAGLQIAQSLRANERTLDVASRNISDGVSLISIADGALETASGIATRLKELAAQSANGTLSDTQRTAINQEAQQLTSELDRIAQTTEFNGQPLLGSSTTIQAGVDASENSQLEVNIGNVSTSSLGLDTLDLSTQAGAQQALDATSGAIASIASSRGELGAVEARLSTAFTNVQTSRLSQTEARSRIEDADIAKETAELLSTRIRLQGSVSLLAQANQQPGLALQLLGQRDR